MQTHRHESHLFEIFQFVEQTRGTDPVILVGDFNIKQYDLTYSLLTRCLRLRDVYTEIYSEKPSDIPRRKEDQVDFILISDELSPKVH